VIPVVVKSDIEIDDVSIQENALIWDTVADNLVDRRTNRLGEVVVVQRRRVGLRTQVSE
jgi:hypothetical protein